MIVWLCFFWLVIYSHLPLYNCIAIITSEINKRPQKDAHFVIPGLNLSSLDSFTMCGRFKIYQFTVQSKVVNGTYRIKSNYESLQRTFPRFWTQSLIDYNHNTDTELFEKLGNKWKLKHIVEVFFLFGKVDYYPSQLRPITWNSFCFKSNQTTFIYTINNHIRTLTKNRKDRAFPNIKKYYFMNSQSMNQPMYGAFTDINVWNSVLSTHDEEKWMHCQLKTPGNIINWQNSSEHLQLTGLERNLDLLDNICLPKTLNHHFISKSTRNILQTIQYCNKFGEMTEISSNEKAIEVKNFLKSYSTRWVFTGYTDIETEGEWVLHNTNKKLTWDNWRPGEPNSWRGNEEDCIAMNVSSLKMYDISCSAKLHAVCNIAEVFLRSKIALMYDHEWKAHYSSTFIKNHRSI